MKIKIFCFALSFITSLEIHANDISENTQFSNCKIVDYESDSQQLKPIYPWELLKQDIEFKKLYYSLIRNKKNIWWLYTLQGPSWPVSPITINNNKMSLIISCKPHDCQENQIYLIYDKEYNFLNGTLIEKNKRQWLGNPSTCIKHYIKSKTQLEPYFPIPLKFN